VASRATAQQWQLQEESVDELGLSQMEGKPVNQSRQLLL